jgi:hypothetical protein
MPACVQVCAPVRARATQVAFLIYIRTFGRLVLHRIRIFRLQRTLSDLNDRRDSLRFIKIFRLGSTLSDLIGATVVLVLVTALVRVPEMGE